MGVLTENYWQFVNKTVICRYFFQSIIAQCFSQLPFIKLKKGSNNYLFILEVFVSYQLSLIFLRWLMRWRCYRVQITIGTAAWSTLSLSLTPSPRIGTPGLVNPSQGSGSDTRARRQSSDPDNKHKQTSTSGITTRLFRCFICEFGHSCPPESWKHSQPLHYSSTPQKFWYWTHN